MKIINSTDELPKGSAIALGAFDGLHIGHKKLIDNVVNFARNNNCKSCVYTFDVIPSGAKRINDNEQRLKIFENWGVDYLYIQHFDDVFKNTSAQDFMNIFVKAAKYISVGFNFGFGKGRTGNAEVLKQFCSENNIFIDVVDAVCYEEKPVSSTRIRKCIFDGDFLSAAAMLGRPFSVSGMVIHGNAIGRTIGFPTANIVVGDLRTMPNEGVYVTTAEVDGKKYCAFSNYGAKPTFDDNTVLLETHLFDFDGDLYGKNIKITFYDKLRGVSKFSSKDELISQLFEDKNKSLKFFEKNGLQI